MTSRSAVDVRIRNNVVELGNPLGRPLVFAHGFGCSQAVWRDVAPAFVDDYRVVLFDHVGAGGSDLSAYDSAKYDSIDGYASDVVDILEQLDLRDVVFVGHSVSAMIGVVAANRDPSRFGALVLIGPSPRYVDDGPYDGGFTQSDIDSMLDTLDSNYLGWSATMAPVIMGNPHRPELGEGLAASFCSVDPTVARQFARVTFLSDNRADLAGVTVPTLVIQSRHDAIASEAVGGYVTRAIPHSTFVLLDATGHLPILSGPAEVISAIRAYLT